MSTVWVFTPPCVSTISGRAAVFPCFNVSTFWGIVYKKSHTAQGKRESGNVGKCFAKERHKYFTALAKEQIFTYRVPGQSEQFLSPSPSSGPRAPTALCIFCPGCGSHDISRRSGTAVCRQSAYSFPRQPYFSHDRGQIQSRGRFCLFR